MNPAEDDSLLAPQDVARRLAVPLSWVYAKAESDELPHVKLGKYLRFRPADIAEYLRRQRRGSAL